MESTREIETDTERQSDRATERQSDRERAQQSERESTNEGGERAQEQRVAQQRSERARARTHTRTHAHTHRHKAPACPPHPSSQTHTPCTADRCLNPHHTQTSLSLQHKHTTLIIRSPQLTRSSRSSAL
eukprot:2206809-Rhodomonas_salina.1